VTLLAFAAAAPCCWAPTVQQTIDIFCPPGPQQQTRRTPLHRSIAWTLVTDGQTDERRTVT